MKEKKEKVKPLYSLPSNILFLFKKAWQMDKSLFFATIVRIPIFVLLPLLATYLSKYTVELVTNGALVEKLILYIVSISTYILSLHLLNNFVNTKIQWRAFGNRFVYISLLCEKIMDADYDNIENPDGQIKMQKAFNGLNNNNGGTQQIFNQFINICSNIIGLITYSALIFVLSPWIVVLLCVMTICNYYINKANNYWTHKNKDNWVPIDRKLYYIRSKSGDFEVAKDIRLYNMSDWFKNIFIKLLGERTVWNKKAEIRSFAVDFASATITLLRDGIAYGFLIYKVTHDGISVADFVLFFALISQYSGWLFGLIDSYNALQVTSLSFCDLREFLDLPDHFNRSKGVDLPKNTCDISFENVSFRYPKSESDTIKNLNFTIKKGEKIAVVGLNGAGKTTMVKLLCGLYRPTAGSIRINGEPIEKYNRDEYYTLLSVVFQDICLMPISVAKNIALCEEKYIDKTKLKKVLKLSGLYDKVQSLSEKENTLLLKSIHDNATDLSGGEKQKLALARALYKDGQLIILDEPTAALDPIAENEMYIKYNELTSGRTSVFISHRLTRFCDRILLIENGEIVEEGSHYELMKFEGKYANMFELQSHYYKEGVNNEAN